MEDLSDFDIISNEFQTELNNDKSTQVNQVRNQIYLILHDAKCYGYTHNKENAMKIITKIADNKVKLLKKTYPESSIYYEFDNHKHMYSIYSVNKMLVVSYDHLETVVKYMPIKYIKDIKIEKKENE